MSTTGRWDELFDGRRWRVAEEYTGTVRKQGRRGEIVITFRRGYFEIDGAAFQSPLSTNKGCKGVLLIETSEDGSLDKAPPVRITVGVAALARAREKYGAIW